MTLWTVKLYKMEHTTIITILILIVISGFIFFIIGKFRAYKKAISNLKDKNQLLQNQIFVEKQNYNTIKAAHQELTSDLIEVRSDFKNLQLRYAEQFENRKNDEDRFEFIANKILEVKTQKFDKQHKEGIKEILEPLKERLKHFESKVETNNKDALERHSSLRQEIKSLTELNEKMSTEAKNLTKALKSDSKQQGN